MTLSPKKLILIYIMIPHICFFKLIQEEDGTWYLIELQYIIFVTFPLKNK
jgi:hypothetical protein